MSTDSQENPEIDWIVDAAATLLSDSDHDLISVNSIADRAGIPSRVVYRHFADREGVFDEIVSRHLKAWFKRVAEMEVETPRDLELAPYLRAQLQAHIEVNEECPAFLHLWYGGLGGTKVTDDVLEYMRQVAELLKPALVSRGLVDPETPELAMQLAIELGDRLIEIAFRDGPRHDQAVVDEGIKMLAAYLGRWAPKS